MIFLSVNLNKVALLRNARGRDSPSLLEAARTVISAGAYGVTVHPRPDQRHIRASDVVDLASLIRAEFPGIELNIEGNPFAQPRADGYPGFAALVEAARPDQCTLVPDADDQITSDHGWDLARDYDVVSRAVTECRRHGARVSLFIDPDPSQIDRVPATGAQRIELYTGPFADVVHEFGIDSAQADQSLNTYRVAAEHAVTLGLGVNAGHDLDLVNLDLFSQIGSVLEVSIGHALIAEALAVGLTASVRAYLHALGGPPS